MPNPITPIETNTPPGGGGFAALGKLAAEYRPTMDKDVLHLWAADILAALSTPESHDGPVKELIDRLRVDAREWAGQNDDTAALERTAADEIARLTILATADISTYNNSRRCSYGYCYPNSREFDERGKIVAWLRSQAKTWERLSRKSEARGPEYADIAHSQALLSASYSDHADAIERGDHLGIAR